MFYNMILNYFYAITWFQDYTTKTTASPARASKDFIVMPAPTDPEIGVSIDGACEGDNVGDSVGYRVKLL